MSQKDYKTLLGFTDQWFTLGILTEEMLNQYGITYETSTDKNAEHYRYGAFRWYLETHRPLSESVAAALYELGVSDPCLDSTIRDDILKLPECPASVDAKALSSGSKSLLRIIHRRRLLSEMQTLSMTPEIFQRGLESRDSVVQRFMIDKTVLTQAQINLLAEQGASHAIRNLALERLKTRQKTAH